jgi:hypothetical protein
VFFYHFRYCIKYKIMGLISTPTDTAVQEGMCRQRQEVGGSYSENLHAPRADGWIERIDVSEHSMGSIISSNTDRSRWISGLPFTATVWGKLPTALTRLVLDLGEPVRLDQDGDVLHRSYITDSEMKPLQELVKLKELRLFRVHNSLQPLVWETVFRNTSDGGMRVLDLQMAAAPIVRSEQWKKAKNVAGLTVPIEKPAERIYRGKDGKGVLHYTVGTGEYLDDFCMRKARIASGLDEAIPLPLWCLKVDGFVIDSLPFEHELSGIVLLTCGENCIDSGLRAPKTGRVPHNKWSKAVNNAASHCLIQWPNWTGIFDGHGDQRDKLGIVVPHETVLSTPVDPFAISLVEPLTEESLQMKALSDALDNLKKSEDFSSSPLLASSGAKASLQAMSNISERGSDVSTQTAPLLATAFLLRAVDSSEKASPSSPTDSGVVIVDGAIDPASPTSVFSNFEHVSPPGSCVDSDPEVTATNENTAPKKSSLAHKVRLSFDWLAGPSSR